MYKNIFNFKILFIIVYLFLNGCASSPDTTGKHENDPFEALNRQIYAFNDGADEYIIGPIAHAYRDVFPDPVRDSIRNFLLNLKAPLSAINATLQGDLIRGVSAVGRFAINSTVGVLGLFDVADYIGIKPVDEDVGQTLGAWGIEPGPYLVLPFLGPSSTRDLVGRVGDLLVDPLGLYLIKQDYEDLLYITKVTKALDTRVRIDGVIEGTRENSLDPYAIMRTMYMQNRARQIANEESEATSIYDIDIDIMLLN